MSSRQACTPDLLSWQPQRNRSNLPPSPRTETGASTASAPSFALAVGSHGVGTTTTTTKCQHGKQLVWVRMIRCTTHLLSETFQMLPNNTT